MLGQKSFEAAWRYRTGVAVFFKKFALQGVHGHTDQQNPRKAKYGEPMDPHSSAQPLVATAADGAGNSGKGHHASWLNSVGFGGEGREDQTQLTEQQIHRAVARFARYLREERELYYPQGQALSTEAKEFFGRFFPPALLEQVRVVALAGRRVSNPSFYEEARALGLTHLPDITHKDSVTFIDALVFNERVTDRILFHALVHATQVRTLGIYLFADLFVRGFLRTKSYSMVPFKAQAFALDMRYASDKSSTFSVEDEIFRWLMTKRF
jgi:hypothetical protein